LILDSIAANQATMQHCADQEERCPGPDCDTFS
jgi:hypothetical protein